MLRTMLKNYGLARLTCPLVRWMSVYPPHYIDPVFSKTRQAKVEQSDFNKLSHVPTKAARTDESESIFYNDLVRKIVNYMTKGGNKELARELLARSFETIKRVQIERLNFGEGGGKTQIVADPEQLLSKAIENSRPLLQLTSIKRGGVKYQVPVPVTERRSYFLAMKWLLEAANEKERKVHLPEKLALEVLDAAHGQGRVVKRKNDLHRQCENNRAYAHYRWS